MTASLVTTDGAVTASRRTRSGFGPPGSRGCKYYSYIATNLNVTIMSLGLFYVIRH